MTAGKKHFQGFYERMHEVSLRGMNYGGGGSVQDSGEAMAIRRVRESIDTQAKVILFDVGANVGDYTRALLREFGDRPAVEVHAFEPAPAPRSDLVSSLGSDGRVHIHAFGLGEKAGQRALFTSEDSGLTSVYRRKLDHLGLEMRPSGEVEIDTIDAFAECQGIRRIDFLKLDVEGHELQVLAGAERMLKEGGIGAIQFEFGGTNIDSRTYFQDFYYRLASRYDLYRILSDGLRLIPRYDERQEVFTTTNYLALQKRN
jgi:FkbM family methyltransferase